MIAGVGGFPDGLGGHLPRPCRIQDHPEPPADQVPVSLSGAGRRVHGGDLPSQPQIPAHMIDHRSRHRLQRREVPQPAEAFQPDHQGQHMLIRPRRTPGPRHLIRLRREEHVQLPRRKPPEPRIRRPLDRCHLRRPPYDRQDQPIQIEEKVAGTSTGQIDYTGQRLRTAFTSGNTVRDHPMAGFALTLAAPLRGELRHGSIFPRRPPP
jgi:hypothetical protein